MNNRQQRVLIAVDGSVQSINAAYYAGRILMPEKATLTLLLVENLLPETLWDNRPDGNDSAKDVNLTGWWEKNHLQYNRKIVEKIRGNLIREGYPEASVEIKINTRQVGIARDIIKESKNGYDLVVAGRIGHNIHTGAVLGNCARKLISSLTHTSLAIVGGLPEAKGIIVGFDDSIGSRRCITKIKESATRKLGKIKVCYVSRSLNLMNGSFDPFQASLDGYHLVEQEHQIKHQSRMRPHLQKAETLLRDEGFSRAGVDSIILRSYMSRSEGLLDEAKKNNCGTLMVGRHGHSRVEEFFLGRVGDKLVQLAQDRAIWLVC